MHIYLERFFLFLLCFSVHQYVSGQNAGSVAGQVYDGKAAAGLPGAACVLLRTTDSSFVKAIQSDLEGNFRLADIGNGAYLLRIQFLGYQTQWRSVAISGTELNLGKIPLTETITNLGEVRIVGKIPPVRQLGDTTQFNATGYKTNVDASAEDLVTKMPGVSLQDGKVNAQGEEVKRILVDNKPFFGDDPSAALKNIPAEMIDKIQVFDQASDQSRFTGFNDGNTTKTINIVTKPGMNQGNFGRAFAGAGTDDRYKAGFTLNRFNGDQRLSLLGQANNINEQNFAISDLVGAFGSGSSGGGQGGGRRGGQGGGGFGMPGQNFLVNNKKGIVNTNAIGLNFSDNLGKKVEVSGSYFFNRSVNTSIQSTIRNFVLTGDSAQAYSETSRTDNTNLNHRFNLRLNWNIDSSNSILYTPRFTVQQNEAVTNTNGENALGERPVNATENAYDANQTSYTMNHEVLLRHKFAKKGRTISLNSNLGNTGTDGTYRQNSDNTFFGTSAVDTLRQNTTLDRQGWSLQNNLTYTEPIHKNGQLSVSYTYNFARTESNRLTRKLNPADGAYSITDSLLSNVFVSEVPVQAGGLGYSYNDKKSNFNANLNYQQTWLRNSRTFPVAGSLDKSFINLLPTVMWRYSISEKKNFRLGYRTAATVPNMDQLQDVVNNSNPLQLSVGNSNLRQDYQHNVFFRYSSTREKNNSSFFLMAGATFTRFYIGNSTLIARADTIANGVAVARGSQLTRPVNLDGYINLRSFLSYGLPVTALKSNFNLNANASYVRTPGMVNGNLNYANSPTVGAGLNITSNISKAADFNLGYNTSYTSVDNSLNTSQNNSYLTQIISAKLNFTFWERLVLNADYNQNLYTGLSAGFNTNFALLNLGLGYKFMKNKQAELRATAFDLLNQNTNVSRTITETYTEDIRSNNLTRYFMLTFTYTLRAFKTPEKQENSPFPGIHRPGMGYPPGMVNPHGGM